MHLRELTPKRLCCAIQFCPAIFESERGTFVLIGRKLEAGEFQEDLMGRIGDGEIALEVPRELLADLALADVSQGHQSTPSVKPSRP